MLGLSYLYTSFKARKSVLLLLKPIGKPARESWIMDDSRQELYASPDVACMRITARKSLKRPNGDPLLED